MRFLRALPIVVLALVGCTDENVPEKTMMPATQPNAQITAESLPKSASTVCVANVSARDRLRASRTELVGEQAEEMASLDAVIADVCN